MNLRRLALFSFTLLLLNTIISAQTRKITGVVSSNAEPLPNVNVAVKNTNITTTANRLGKYAITVPDSSTTLVFSLLNYQVKEVKLNNNSQNINVDLLHISIESLVNMTLNDLLNVKISSISKKEESFMSAASSIYVLTEEDIERSGANKIQDVLNLVPGAWSQEANYNNSINAFRTKSDEYPQSFQVLLDGVSIWSSVTGGPLYNYINIPVKHIKKIEVIKGPGGTIYGSNANTGIISIYTKEASDIEGGLLSTDFGTTNYINPYINYSKKLNNNIDVSMFFDYKGTDGYNKNEKFIGDSLIIDNAGVNGSDTTIANAFRSDNTDGTKAVASGINLKAKLSSTISSTTNLFFSYLESNTYSYTAKTDSLFITKDGGSDFNIGQKFNFTFNKNHSLFFNSNYRNQSINVANNGSYNPKVGVLNFEIQDNIKYKFNEISIGANYQFVDFDINTNDEICESSYANPHRNEMLYSAFIQDKLLYKDLMQLTLGIKAETWTLASKKPEFSPSARFQIEPIKKLSLWTAYSRSITTPGLFHAAMERYIADVSGDNSLIIGVVPGHEIKPTVYNTFEFGFRTNPIKQISFDVSSFYLKFDNAITTNQEALSKFFEGTLDMQNDLVPSITGDYMIVPILFTNVYKGTSYGGEAVLKVYPLNNIRLEASYSYLKYKTEGLRIPESDPAEYFAAPGGEIPYTPEHIFRFRSYLDIPQKGWYLTINGLYASESFMGNRYNYVTQKSDDDNGIYPNEADHRFRLDLMLEKKLLDDKLSVRIWGKNILADPYVEFYSEYYAAGYPQPIHRTFGIGVSYKFSNSTANQNSKE